MITSRTRTVPAVTLMGLLALGLGGAANASTVSTQDKVATRQGVNATKVSAPDTSGGPVATTSSW